MRSKRTQRAEIQKWGSDLGLRIPDSLAREAGIQAGSKVDLFLKDGTLFARPVHRYTLKDLVAGITRNNRHEAIISGESLGRERR